MSTRTVPVPPSEPSGLGLPPMVTTFLVVLGALVAFLIELVVLLVVPVAHFWLRWFR